MKAILPVLTLAALSAAQGVSIKGTIKDASGAAVAGALVKLEKAGYQTTSGADGSFTLTESSTALGPRAGAGSPLLSASLDKGFLALYMGSAAEVSILTFDLGGKLVSSMRETLAAGRHSIALPGKGDGIQVHSIRVGRSEVTVRSLSLPNGGRTSFLSASGASRGALAKQAAGFKDVVLATKAGLLNYRIGVTNPTATVDMQMIASAGTVTDPDGNEYQTIKLGNQTWTVDHYRSTKYNDGTVIPIITDGSAWANRTAGAYCFYNNSTNADTNKLFGALYNWHAVNTGKLAPTGWRIPSNNDWTALESYLASSGVNHDGSTSGNKYAKAMASRTDWNTSATAGAVGNDQSKNNKSGYNAQPTGFRLQTGTFTAKGGRAIIQSSTEYAAPFGWFADIDANAAALRRSDDWKVMGFSVRLLKN